MLTILDTDGDPLRLAMRAEPDVVSPNELECEELVGHEFNDDHDRAQAAAEMTRLGAGEAIMTVQDGCFAPGARGGRSGALPRARGRAGGPLADRVGRRVPGRLRGRALLRARAG